MNASRLPLEVIGRVLLGLYFLVPGVMKIAGFAGTLAYMNQHGVPWAQPLLIATIFLQVGGGLGLIAGWRTQAIALLFAGLTLAISLYMHDFWNGYEGGSQQHEMQNFIKNMAILAGLLVLAGRGAPRASLDARASRR